MLTAYLNVNRLGPVVVPITNISTPGIIPFDPTFPVPFPLHIDVVAPGVISLQPGCVYYVAYRVTGREDTAFELPPPPDTVGVGTELRLNNATIPGSQASQNTLAHLGAGVLASESALSGTVIFTTGAGPTQLLTLVNTSAQAPAAPLATTTFRDISLSIYRIA